MKNLITSICVLLAVFCQSQETFEPLDAFQITSDGVKQFSAGVYDENEVLVRTLFTGRVFPAGNHTYKWDGKDDFGKVLPKGKYSVQLLSHQLKAEWEGTALNTSSQFSNKVWGGSKKHNGYYGAAIDIYEHTNGWVYYCTGMSENNATLRKFHLDSPDVAVYLKKNSSTYYAEQQGEKLGGLGSTYHIASDGNYLYVPAITWQSGTANVQNNYVFIMKFNLATDELAPFTVAGKSISPGNYNYPSVIVLNSGLERFASWEYNFSGVAVDGQYLYTAQKEQKTVRVFNKVSGEAVSTTTAINSPRRMASDGKYLWMIYGTNSVGKFSVSAGGVINETPVLTLSNVSDPHSLSIQTVGGRQYVYLTDGGPTQQVVKRFRTDNGNQDMGFNTVGYFGQLGGYSNNSIVSDDRFYFTKAHDKLAGLHVKSDGTMWLCDDGNNRMLRFDPSFTKTHRVEWQGATYSLFMPESDNSRLLVEYREYKVGYTGPLQNAWELKRQFEPSWPFQGSGAVPLSWVKTMSNGKTIAAARNYADNKLYIIELTDKGARTIISFGDEGRDRTFRTRILPDGSLIETERTNEGLRFRRYALTGYSNVIWNGETYQNPVWETTYTIVGYIANTDRAIGVNGGFRALTDENKIIVFDEGKDGRGYHIGALQYGLSTPQEWKWRAAKAVNSPGGAPYPTDGSFEIGNGVHYPASDAKSVGDFVHWQYNGEFWNGGQSNMHHLLYKNGLQLMQFGVAIGNSTAVLPKGYPEMGGNTKSIAMTKIDDVLYVWQGEEGYHCGVMRWKITGLNTIKKNVIPLYKGNKLEANFSADKQAGCAPLAVNFTDKSDPGAVDIQKRIWDFGDGTTSTEQNPSHTFTKAGVYRVQLKVVNATGDTSIFQGTDSILVSGNPTARIINDTAACVLSPVSFAGKVETSHPSALNWHWNFGDGQTESVQTPDKKIYQAAGIYNVSLTLSDEFGCSTQVQSKVTVYPAPVVEAGPDAEICLGSSQQLKASGAVKYSWESSSSLSCTDCDDPVATPTSRKEYKVTGYNSYGCSAVDQVAINVLQPFELKIGGKKDICVGETVELTASGADQYMWSPSSGVSNSTRATITAKPRASTLYQVVAKDNAGCFTDTASLYVKVHQLPVISAGADAEICRGSVQRLQANGAATYTWSASSSLSCTDCASPMVAPATTTQFVVTGFDDNGCSASDSVVVTVRQPFKVTIDPVADICIGRSATLTARGADQYQWLPSAGLNNPGSATTTVVPQATTQYTVVAKDNIGCFTDTASVQVKVWPFPSVEAGNAQVLSIGQSLKLNPVYSDDVNMYRWSHPQTLSCSNCAFPEARPKSETTYRIEVANRGGCLASDEVTVRVICNNGNLFIPNTFSPNKDGRNDRFFPRGSGIDRVKSFKIYNRWGELVYSKENFPANEPMAGWDGRYRGQALPSDVFVYSCEVVCTNNELLVFKGDVTLLR